MKGVRELLEGRPGSDEGSIQEAADLARRAAAPLATGGLLSPPYRRLRVGISARDGLRAIGRPGPGAGG